MEVSKTEDAWLIERFGESITVTGQCQTHGDWSKPSRSKTPEAIRNRCPQCDTDAEIARKQSEERAKGEAAERARLSHLEEIGISHRHADKTFENFVADCPEKARALAACKALAERIVDNPRRAPSLILCGNPGTGKTHLTSALIQHTDKHGRDVLKRNAADIFRSIKSTWGKDSEESEHGLLEFAGSLDLLVIDEAGTQHGSDTERLFMFEIINRRYENCLPTVLISNLSIERLREEVGERVIDRLREDGGKLLPFTGESWRKT